MARCYATLMTMIRTISLAVAVAVQSAGALAQSVASPAMDRGDFGPFMRSLNIRPYGYDKVPDAAGTGSATVLERFEVRSGDCSVQKSIDDCKQDRERSELSEQGRRTPRGSTAWYGWHFYLGEDWPDVWPTKTVIGQFHQDKSHPVWMFLNYKGALVLDDHSTGGSKGYTELVPANELKGRWHRIEVHARWERDTTGFFKVWVDGVAKFEMAGPTMTRDLVFFKYGVYRSFVSRFVAAAGIPGVPTQVALFANVRKATTREGLN